MAAAAVTSRFPTIASAPETIPGLSMTKKGLQFHIIETHYNQLRVFNAKELRNHEVHIVDGNLAVGTGKKKKFPNAEPYTRNRDLLFVMAPDRKIYIEYPVQGMLHHSSLIGDFRPIAVGTLRTLNGKLIRITEESDQYLPAGRLRMVVDTLQKMGAVIDPAFKLGVPVELPQLAAKKEEKKSSQPIVYRGPLGTDFSKARASVPIRV